MSFFSPKLGIDLGTTTTLVYVPEKGVVLNEPSVVAVSLVDKKILAVGAEAKVMVGKTPDTIVAYRPMKDGVIANYRVTEIMLSYYIKKALGRFNFFKPDVIISVPAGVTSTERRAVVEAAVKAGAKNAYVVKEPVLAAIGAGIPIQEPRGHIVADIGGSLLFRWVALSRQLQLSVRETDWMRLSKIMLKNNTTSPLEKKLLKILK